jgi:EAL domain-containing protein (putative c-di-GMP-specific phosphodiesterase class I)
MAERLFTLLERTGIAPESLRLEVTERAVWENERRALEQLGGLRAMGVCIAVDDFGVGYSSLAQLHRFDFDELKIDRSLVTALGQDPRAGEMIDAILILARSLRIDVVSEGVETADQLHILRGMRCPSGQGFWFARPAKPEAIAELLEQGPLW